MSEGQSTGNTSLTCSVLTLSACSGRILGITVFALISILHQSEVPGCLPTCQIAGHFYIIDFRAQSAVRCRVI